MKLYEAADQMRGILKQGFSSLPIVWGNALGENPPATGFVHVDVNGLSGTQITMGGDGGSDYRDNAVLFAAVCVPRGSRTDKAERWAEDIRALYSPPDFAGTGIIIGDRNITTPGVDHAQSRWFIIQVSIEFTVNRLE